MKIAVLGAFGLMAEATLHHLAKDPTVKEILAADINLSRSTSVLSRLPNRRKIRPIQIDINDTATCTQALKGSSCVINCSWYEFNLKAMKLSLALKAHYVDLGGLYHTTLKQMKLDNDFKRSGLLAILGIGSAPGISNMMTAWISQDFDTIDTLGIYDASFDPALDGKSFIPPFSIKTLLDEHKQNAPVFLNGKIKEVQAHTLSEEFEFKKPIGRMRVGAVIHSEVATLPGYLKSKKIKNLFFKIGYPPSLKPQLEILEAIGFSEDKPVRLNGQNISPKSFLAELSRQSVSQTPFQNPEDFEILRVRAIGTSSGQFLEKILDCEMRGQNGLSAGALGVGIPAAIAAVMILKRQTSLSSGVTAPENALRQNIFFSALRASRAFQFMETRIKAV